MTLAEPHRAGAVPPEEGSGEEMTLFEHLAELRSRLFKAAGAVILGLVVGLAVHRPVLDLLIEPYCNLDPELRSASTALTPTCQLVIMDVLGQFFLVMKTAAIVAVVIAGPFVCYQIWRFVTPGLRPAERRYALPFLVISQVLFAGGAVFSYFVLPRALSVLLGIGPSNVGSLLEANEYLRFLLHMMIGFGVAFELPLILITLVLMGVVGSQGLRTYRRHAIFGTFVAAALITPTTDPLTMSLMAGPLVLFYEGSVLVARVVERRRRRRERAASA